MSLETKRRRRWRTFRWIVGIEYIAVYFVWKNGCSGYTNPSVAELARLTNEIKSRIYTGEESPKVDLPKGLEYFTTRRPSMGTFYREDEDT